MQLVRARLVACRRMHLCMSGNQMSPHRSAPIKKFQDSRRDNGVGEWRFRDGVGAGRMRGEHRGGGGTFGGGGEEEEEKGEREREKACGGGVGEDKVERGGKEKKREKKKRGYFRYFITLFNNPKK